MENIELINIASSIIHSKELKEGLVGDVGCALLAGNGKIYTGVCIGVNSNGYCAERVAIGKMITDDQEYVIKKIVATWKDENEVVHVIPPCGHCRAAIHETDESNINNTEIILDLDKNVRLKELLPYHDWWQKIG